MNNQFTARHMLTILNRQNLYQYVSYELKPVINKYSYIKGSTYMTSQIDLKQQLKLNV